MDFAELIGSVESKLNETAVAEAFGEDLPKMKSALREAKGNYADLREDLSRANNESKGRKIEIRDTLKPEIESLQDKIKDLEGKTDMSKYETELKDLRAYKQGSVEKLQAAFVTDFGNIAEHDNFGKAKNYLTLPKTDDKGDFITDEDGAFDFGDVTPEQMESNIAELNKLQSLGLFDPAESADDGTKNKASGKMQKREQRGEMDAINNAESMADLHAAVPE